MPELVCLDVPFCSLSQGGLSVGTKPFRGPRHLVFLLDAIAFWGRFPWWGDACVSRYHGPSRRLSERRGGPWAPPPLVFLILLAGWLFLVGVGTIGVCLGSCLGTLGNQIYVCSCRPSDLSPCFFFWNVCCFFSLFPLVPLGRLGGHRHNDFYLD